jgi:undecaprenyl-diphosphatase
MHEILASINTFFQSLGVWGLSINAAIESCLPGFPLPPDVLLIAMNLVNPQKALIYALICTTGSVLGGSIGYLLGYFGGRPLFYYFFRKNIRKLKSVEGLYEQYGTVAVFFSAFTPIPYNIFTIASGILKMNFLKFFLVSCLGRGGRFFLVSIVLMYFGEAIKAYMNLVIIAASVILVVFFITVYAIAKYRKNKTIKKEN